MKRRVRSAAPRVGILRRTEPRVAAHAAASHRRAVERTRVASESRRTVIIAAIANLVIALAKFAAGAISGSAAILAEGAHSVADTGNQVFLLVSLRMGERPADEDHPFGYGKERFFWAFMAAMGIFVLGAGFSFLQGISGLISGHQEDTKGFIAAYIVLAISAAAEGTSWF